MGRGPAIPAVSWLNAYSISPNDVALFTGRQRASISHYGSGRNPLPDDVVAATHNLARQQGMSETEATAFTDRFVELCNTAFAVRHPDKVVAT